MSIQSVWGVRSRAQFRRFCRQLMVVVFMMASTFSTFGISGCSRQYYRSWADRDATELIQSKQDEAAWPIGFRSVEPRDESRLMDIYDKDLGPSPADDPVVENELFYPAGMDNRRYWETIQSGAPVENPIWMSLLPTNEQGQTEIDQATANQLALIHNREYQSQVEQIYLNALSLSGNRFEFVTQWLAGTGTDFNASRDGADAIRNLSQVTNLGFSKNLAAGGQFVASLVNSLSWEVGGNHFSLGSGNLVFTLTQPLLRGAYRHVRLESLVQAERDFVYSIRDFAHFRREFYLEVTTSYLNLLAQSQSIKNQESNLESLRRSLSEQEEKAARKLVSRIEVDQIFQQFQSAKIGLLASQQSYQDSADQFRFLLGLPASVDLKIDEKILNPFQLSDPKLGLLTKRIERLRLELVQFIPPEENPPKTLLDRAAKEIVQIEKEIAKILPVVREEYKVWGNKLQDGLREGALEEEKLDFTQQQKLAKQIGEQIEALEKQLKKFQKDYQVARKEFGNLPEEKVWEQLISVLGKDCNDLVNSIFIIQTQIRLFLIELKPYDIESKEAVEVALRQRLDLMNRRGQLNDAFRQVEVTADRLESNLDVVASASIATDPSRTNSVRFDSSANSYRLGLRLDGPLIRLNERNDYRASQIRYQQARRSYMELEDQITNQIRSDLRSLRINWLRFQISRQQLIAASRQVEQAQLNLQNIRGDEAGVNSNLTRDLLQSLQGLLEAKDQLISSWINYEVARIRIAVDSDHLFLDEEGQWINSNYNPGIVPVAK